MYNQVNPTDYIYGSTQFKIFVPPNSKAEPGSLYSIFIALLISFSF